MKTSLPWRFDSKFILNIHIHIRYSNNNHQIALFVFVFILLLRTNTICIHIRFIFRKRILFVFVFVFVPKLLFVPTLFSNPFKDCKYLSKLMYCFQFPERNTFTNFQRLTLLDNVASSNASQFLIQLVGEVDTAMVKY